MKVSECKKCVYCKRKTWTSYYEPSNYHAIGVTHAYHYCERYNKRCLTIKGCGAFISMEESDNEEIKEYKPLELDYNVQTAVENLKTAYWSNEPEKVANTFTEAEDIIITAICHHNYTLCKEAEDDKNR